MEHEYTWKYCSQLEFTCRLLTSVMDYKGADNCVCSGRGHKLWARDVMGLMATLSSTQNMVWASALQEINATDIKTRQFCFVLHSSYYQESVFVHATGLLLWCLFMGCFLIYPICMDLQFIAQKHISRSKKKKYKWEAVLVKLDFPPDSPRLVLMDSATLSLACLSFLVCFFMNYFLIYLHLTLCLS